MTRVIKTKAEFEGQLYEKYVVIEGEGISPWEAGRQFEIVGKPHSRIDGIERVTGRAVYAHDVFMPGMLYGRILRCPHPKARLKRLDTGEAECIPGVRLVLSHLNTPEIPWRGGQTFIFNPELRYEGDEVACVIADDEAICEDAVEKIAVEYEPLPFVVDPLKALDPDAPKVQTSSSGNLFGGKPEIYERGSIEEGFSQADVVVEGVFRTPTALHNSLETHGCAACWEGNSVIIWDSTQYIHGVRDQVAGALGLPQHRVRIIKHYMGGGFGSKIEAGKHTVIAALASKRAGRPVRVLLDRRAENLSAGNRPASIQTMKLGAKKDGTLTAIYQKSVVALGASAHRVASPCGPAKRFYRCPHVKTEDHGVFINTGYWLAFRAPGYVEGAYALESIMDELANKLGMDPVELRLKNYAETDPLTGRPYSTKGLKKAYALGAERIGWKDRKEKKQRLSTAVEKVGFGMASQVWSGGGGPPAYALVKINADGTAVVLTGTQDIGTGTRTVLCQIAAETLNFPVSSVSVQLGDTQVGVFSPLSAGSMSLPSVGPAVRAAAEEAKTRLLEVGSQVLEIPLSKLKIQDGRFLDEGSGNRIGIDSVLKKLGGYMIIGRGERGPNSEEKNVNTFGAQFAQVRVDTETGQVKVEKVVAVHESGRVINPLTAHSQLVGGITMGIGFAVTEQRFVDPRVGIVLNADLDHYKVPTVKDIPEIVAEMIDSPDPVANSIGAKGLGEPPVIPTAGAIANAVADALGKRIYEIPFAPDRVLMEIAEDSKDDPKK
jgi:xanthine dehydrogenase YagR molybdenum-binding subunit